MASTHGEPPRGVYTLETCLEEMLNKSRHTRQPHCPPEWEQYSKLCWGPALAASKIALPCPDDGFLNPRQLAYRTCTADATWYVNLTFDDNPYTDFSECLILETSTLEEDLRKLVGEKILLVLKALDASEQLRLTLHIISVVMLVVTVITSVIMAIKSKERRAEPYRFVSFMFGAAALLLNNGITLSSTAVNNVWHQSRCRTAKYLVIFSSIVLYESLFGYIYLSMAALMDYVLKPVKVGLVVLGAFILAVVLVSAEVSIEINLYSNQFCGFGTLQTSYHWITTGFKLLLILSIICLDIVAIYGSFYLKLPHLSGVTELRPLRQQSVSAMVVTLYNTIREVLLIMVYGVAYLSYLDSPIELYVRIFSVVNAAQGIVYSLFMCFIDLELWHTLPCSHPQQTPNNATSYLFASAEHAQISEKNKFSKNQRELTDDDMIDVDYLHSRANKTESRPKIYETRVVFGPNC